MLPSSRRAASTSSHPCLPSSPCFVLDTNPAAPCKQLLHTASKSTRRTPWRPALASLGATPANPLPKQGRKAQGQRSTPSHFKPLAVGVVEGSHQKRYVWDAKQRRLRAFDPEDLAGKEDYGRSLQGHLQRVVHSVRSAFLPNPSHVTPDYWQYARWKAVHRYFSSMSSVFATQSLLRAVGVGAKRALPAAAAINWVLKDGLGRLGRLTVATRFGESFDSDLKRFRFTTSMMYCTALSLEYLTPLFPQHFLLMASLANVGKSVGLTTFIATQPAFHRSFARGENLADISAKAQAQQMVVDNLGLATAVGLTHLCRNSEAARGALPFLAFPILATGDLYAIYRELRSIHLRTLNKERAEIIAEQWLRTGQVPSPLEVSDAERLILPARISSGCLPLTIAPLHRTVRSEGDLQQLLGQTSDEKYLLTYTPPCQWGVEAGGPEGPTLVGSAGARSGTDTDSSRSRLRGEYWRKPTTGAPTAPTPGPSSSGASSTVGWRGWWREWVGRRGRGGVRVTLQKDATHSDILQAVLQAAYLRAALQAAPARPPPPLPPAATVESVGQPWGRPPSSRRPPPPPTSTSLGSKGAMEGGGGEQEDDCCQSCRGLDKDEALRESKRLAQSGLPSFTSQLAERGWQVAPFMLSSTEKQYYIMMT